MRFDAPRVQMCYNCRRRDGHLADQCPFPKTERRDRLRERAHYQLNMYIDATTWDEQESWYDALAATINEHLRKNGRNFAEQEGQNGEEPAQGDVAAQDDVAGPSGSAQNEPGAGDLVAQEEDPRAGVNDTEFLNPANWKKARVVHEDLPVEKRPVAQQVLLTAAQKVLEPVREAAVQSTVKKDTLEIEKLKKILAEKQDPAISKKTTVKANGGGVLPEAPKKVQVEAEKPKPEEVAPACVKQTVEKVTEPEADPTKEATLPVLTEGGENEADQDDNTHDDSGHGKSEDHTDAENSEEDGEKSESEKEDETEQPPEDPPKQEEAEAPHLKKFRRKAMVLACYVAKLKAARWRYVRNTKYFYKNIATTLVDDAIEAAKRELQAENLELNVTKHEKEVLVRRYTGSVSMKGDKNWDIFMILYEQFLKAAREESDEEDPQDFENGRIAAFVRDHGGNPLNLARCLVKAAVDDVKTQLLANHENASWDMSGEQIDMLAEVLRPKVANMGSAEEMLELVREMGDEFHKVAVLAHQEAAMGGAQVLVALVRENGERPRRHSLGDAQPEEVQVTQADKDALLQKLEEGLSVVEVKLEKAEAEREVIVKQLEALDDAARLAWSTEMMHRAEAETKRQLESEGYVFPGLSEFVFDGCVRITEGSLDAYEKDRLEHMTTVQLTRIWRRKLQAPAEDFRVDIQEGESVFGFLPLDDAPVFATPAPVTPQVVETPNFDHSPRSATRKLDFSELEDQPTPKNSDHTELGQDLTNGRDEEPTTERDENSKQFVSDFYAIGYVPHRKVPGAPTPENVEPEKEVLSDDYVPKRQPLQRQASQDEPQPEVQDVATPSKSPDTETEAESEQVLQAEAQASELGDPDLEQSDPQPSGQVLNAVAADVSSSATAQAEAEPSFDQLLEKLERTASYDREHMPNFLDQQVHDDPFEWIVNHLNMELSKPCGGRPEVVGYLKKSLVENPQKVETLAVRQAEALNEESKLKEEMWQEKQQYVHDEGALRRLYIQVVKMVAETEKSRADLEAQLAEMKRENQRLRSSVGQHVHVLKKTYKKLVRQRRNVPTDPR